MNADEKPNRWLPALLGIFPLGLATAAGLAIAFGGGLRDLVTHLAMAGELGPALTGPAKIWIPSMSGG